MFVSQSDEIKKNYILKHLSSKTVYEIIDTENESELLPVDLVLFLIFKEFPEAKKLINKNFCVFNFTKNISKKFVDNSKIAIGDYEYKHLDSNLSDSDCLIAFYFDNIIKSSYQEVSFIYFQIFKIIFDKELNKNHFLSNIEAFSNIFISDDCESEALFYAKPRISQVSDFGYLDMAFYNLIHSDSHFLKLVTLLKK